MLLSLVLWAAVSVCSGQPLSGLLGDPIIPIPIIPTPPPSGTTPQAPAVTPISVNYDVATGAITISTVAPMGTILVVFENLTTGTFITDSFDSTYPGVFFLPNESGIWEITLTLPSGAMFGGSFVL